MSSCGSTEAAKLTGIRENRYRRCVSDTRLPPVSVGLGPQRGRQDGISLLLGACVNKNGESETKRSFDTCYK